MYGEYTKQMLLYRDSKITNTYILFNLPQQNTTSKAYFHSTDYSPHYAPYSR